MRFHVHAAAALAFGRSERVRGHDPIPPFVLGNFLTFTLSGHVLARDAHGRPVGRRSRELLPRLPVLGEFPLADLIGLFQHFVLDAADGGWDFGLIFVPVVTMVVHQREA